MMRSSPGLSVVVVGVIEAVDVRDGHFTPVLRCDESPGLIALELADRTKKRVMQNLCRRVVVEGRLHVADADGHRLEVRCVQALRPGQTSVIRRRGPVRSG